MNKFTTILISIFATYFYIGCKEVTTPDHKSIDYLDVEIVSEFNNKIGEAGFFTEAFLPSLEHDTVFFETQNGLIKLYNDSVTEDCIIFTLLEQTKTKYKVIATSSTNDYCDVGYISKKTPLRIFSRAYNAKENPLKIYSKPSESSPFCADSVYFSYELEVLDFKGAWLKVRYYNNGKVFKGWISPDQQCSNPYSTCS